MGQRKGAPYRNIRHKSPTPATEGTDLPRLLQARDTAAEVPYLFARKLADALDIARYRAAFFPRPE